MKSSNFIILSHRKQFVKALAYATHLENMESFLYELSGGFLRDIRIDYLIHKDSVKTGTSYMNRQHATKLTIIEVDKYFSIARLM